MDDQAQQGNVAQAGAQPAQSATRAQSAPAPVVAAPTFDEVNLVLAEIRPAIQMDGGDIELVAVKPEIGEVHIRMAGACIGCPASSMTLKMGIEQAIQEKFPDLEVIPVP